MGDENKEVYGQDLPPVYDPGLISVPVSLYWSQNDLLADPSVSQA